MRRALITGITGQDGAYLANLLLEKGYEVYGVYRRVSTPNFWRLQSLNALERINLIPGDMIDMSSLVEAIKISMPDEIYNLAAQSFVGASFVQPISTGEINGLGVARILEAIRQIDPKIKFYQASTSEMFGDACLTLQTNERPFHPLSPYAAAKLYGYWMTKIYRDGYGFFACNGILFNHESPLRGLEFVTRKISNAVAKIELGIENELRLGNLEAKRDWGYAPEYVESMWLMLQQKEPGDFLIATNECHSVKEFAYKAFEVVGLDPAEHITIDKNLLRPLDVGELRGDYSEAERNLGWKPKLKFDELVKLMVREDLNRWEKWLNGERFPWDAPNYPSEAKILIRSLRI